MKDYNGFNVINNNGVIMPSIIRTKLVIVGDTAVGKSAVAQMFVSNGRNFLKNYNMTLGVDILRKSVIIPDTSYTVELFIYDSGGLDVYKESLPKYWNQPDLLLGVFDITKPDTLTSLSKWISFARQYKSSAALPCAIFGNKVDLTERRSVSVEVTQNEAENLEATYFEGSAKENQGIEEPFVFLAKEWYSLNFKDK